MNERLTPEHRAELRAIATETGTNTVTMTASELAAVLDALDTTECQLAEAVTLVDLAERHMTGAIDATERATVDVSADSIVNSVLFCLKKPRWTIREWQAARVGVDTEEKPQ